MPPLVTRSSLGLFRLGLVLTPVDEGGGGGVLKSPLVSSRPKSCATMAWRAPQTAYEVNKGKHMAKAYIRKRIATVYPVTVYAYDGVPVGAFRGEDGDACGCIPLHGLIGGAHETDEWGYGSCRGQSWAIVWFAGSKVCNHLCGLEVASFAELGAELDDEGVLLGREST